MGKNSVPPHSFSPPYRWGKTMYPPTLFPHLTDGEKQCTPTLFFPTLQMGKNNVPPPLFFPTLQMERKSELHSFSPSVRWKFENVPHTLFSHCNKMGKQSVPPTLFFPIIEGEKVQRVKVYPYPLPLFHQAQAFSGRGEEEDQHSHLSRLSGPAEQPSPRHRDRHTGHQARVVSPFSLTAATRLQCLIRGLSWYSSDILVLDISGLDIAYEVGTLKSTMCPPPSLRNQV